VCTPRCFLLTEYFFFSPAIYPAADLFLAPFLAAIAERIDATLYEKDLQDNDTAFLATFVVVTACFGLVLSGLLSIVAARIKLANLGLFLPYSVLCGFFSTVGILMWTLGLVRAMDRERV